MSLDLKDLFIAGAVGYVAYRLTAHARATSAPVTTTSIARTVDPAVVVAPIVIDAYPDYYPWGWGPTVFNFGGGRRGYGGHHHRGGGRRGRR